jgi:hypothetical protein
LKYYSGVLLTFVVLLLLFGSITPPPSQKDTLSANEFD